MARPDVFAALVSSDVIRDQLFPRPKFTNAEHNMVFEYMHKEIKKALRLGYVTIADATNLRERHRIPLRAYAAAFNAPIYEFFITTPQEERERRIRDRKRGDVESTIMAARKMEQYIEKPVNAVALDGTQPVADLVKCVLSVVELSDGSDSTVSS